MASYIDVCEQKFKELDDNSIILAIESSCDETALSISRGRNVLASVISSQIEIHKRFGGVVPEIASRNHILAIDNLLEEVLLKAGVQLKEVNCIAVTYGPGLLGALLVGISYAKGLAYSLKIPIMAIDHIKGHIFANYISSPDLKPPYITLLASGGHTAVLKVNSYFNVEVLGETQDDAVGEAFDKVARVLGLSYPGGPEIEKFAVGGNLTYNLPRAYKNEKHLNFSFSGLKTAVINIIHNAEQKGETVNKKDMAYSFQEEAVSVLVENAIKGAKRNKIYTISLAGGVGANQRLREKLTDAGAKNRIKIVLPPKNLCTDNAEMIGIACYEALKEGIISFSGLDLDAVPNL